MHNIILHLEIAGECSAEVDDYGITWPSTKINMNATSICPDGNGMNNKLSYIVMQFQCTLQQKFTGIFILGSIDIHTVDRYA